MEKNDLWSCLNPIQRILLGGQRQPQLQLTLYQGHQASPTHLNNLDRINERISGQPLDPLLEGGAEEHDLAIGSHVVANRPDLSFEAHLEHFVSLAEQSNSCCQLLSDIQGG